MDKSTERHLPDYHTHHELCLHASGRTVDYARAALANGLREFAATDHCPTDVGFGKEHRMTLDQFDQYRADVMAARQAVPEITIRYGVEADYYPGCEGFLRPFLAGEDFDLVLGSVHFLDYWSQDPNRRGLSGAIDPLFIWKEYFILIGKLADTGLYDIVTHLDLPKRFGNPIDINRLREVALPALDRIAAAGMAIEINTSGMTHSIKAMYPSREILAWAAERSIGLVFGSDAHSPARVGDGFSAARQMALDAGFTHHRFYEKRRWTHHALS